MLGFMWWILIGLVAGMLARLLMPGRQPMGLVLTIVLGLTGSLVGGFISSMLFREDPTDPGFQPAGLIMSTLGAVLVLVIYSYLQKRRVAGP
jgi:uncharacterized membrane protein YeaQ/YmgE (transglycosylase-associated protein family)